MKFIYEETDEELYLKVLAPYLDNVYEETIFESSQIKAQQERVKLLNWELCSETLKTLRMNWTDQCMSVENLMPKKMFILQYTDNSKVEKFHLSYNKVATITRRWSEQGAKNCLIRFGPYVYKMLIKS